MFQKHGIAIYGYFINFFMHKIFSFILWSFLKIVVMNHTCQNSNFVTLLRPVSGHFIEPGSATRTIYFQKVLMDK